MATLLTSELASKSCNYISFLSSTSKYGNDSGKYTDGVYPFSLRRGYHFPLLMLINNVLHRGIPVFPAGTDLIASCISPEHYVLGFPLTSCLLGFPDQKHSQTKGMSPTSSYADLLFFFFFWIWFSPTYPYSRQVNFLAIRNATES